MSAGSSAWCHQTKSYDQSGLTTICSTENLFHFELIFHKETEAKWISRWWIKRERIRFILVELWHNPLCILRKLMRHEHSLSLPSTGLPRVQFMSISLSVTVHRQVAFKATGFLMPEGAYRWTPASIIFNQQNYTFKHYRISLEHHTLSSKLLCKQPLHSSSFTPAATCSLLWDPRLKWWPAKPETEAWGITHVCAYISETPAVSQGCSVWWFNTQ